MAIIIYNRRVELKTFKVSIFLIKYNNMDKYTSNNLLSKVTDWMTDI